MTISGFKSTDIENRSKVEPVTVAPQGYKRMGLDVNTLIGRFLVIQGNTAAASSADGSTVLLQFGLSSVKVGDILEATSTGQVSEITNISGNTVTFARAMTLGNVTPVIIYRPISLQLDSSGRLSVTISSITGLPFYTDTLYSVTGLASMWFNPGDSSFNPPYGTTYGPQVEAYQFGIWSTRLLDGAGNSVASATTTPGASDRGLVVRNIPSGTQTISGAVTQSGTWNIGTVTTLTGITNALPTGSNVIGGVTQSGTWNVGLTGPSTGTITSTNISTEAQLIASNASRRGLKIFNNGTADVYVLEGSGTASSTNFSDIAHPGVPLYYGAGTYTGAIRAISSSGTNAVLCTEFT